MHLLLILRLQINMTQRGLYNRKHYSNTGITYKNLITSFETTENIAEDGSVAFKLEELAPGLI